MQGFGTTTRVFDDPHVTDTFSAQTLRAAVVVPSADQSDILDALYVELGLTRVRPATGDGPIESHNDNSDPNVTDLAGFNFAWKLNDAHIDYVKAAMTRGVDTHFLSPVVLESWMDESNPAEYVEWAMAILRRWRDQGVEPPYYSVVNEPGYFRSGIWSGEYLRDVIKLLGPQLAAEGFATKIVLPDDLNADEANSRAQIIMADPTAAAYVGALAYHMYGGSATSQTALKTLAAAHDVPVWMTEFAEAPPFDWANLVLDLIVTHGVSAVDSMWGFFGQWDPATTHLIEINHTGDTYTGWQRLKSFYYTGQFSRFAPPGSIRIDAASPAADIKVAAFVVGTDIALVVINDSDTTVLARAAFPSLDGRTTATGERTSATEDWTSVGPIAVVQDSIDLSLPPKSVTSVIVR
jgi:O-glycosyl hydrolase